MISKEHRIFGMSESRQSSEFERRKVLCLRALVDMAVMRVGKMLVSMLDRIMTMSMGVLQAGNHNKPRLVGVVVPVMLVVRMFMLVIHGVSAEGRFRSSF